MKTARKTARRVEVKRPVATDQTPEILSVEDAQDLKDARTALKAFRESGEKAIPWAEVKKNLGL